jgi:hypothetical protein
MPKGFDIFDGSELLSAFVQGGTIPAEHESQSRFLIMDPGAAERLRAVLQAAAEGRKVPPGLAKDAQDVIDAMDTPGEARWKKITANNRPT